MASSIQLLRSTIAQERPFPGNLLEGQPAVNLNVSEPGLFFKTADGSLVKFGPVAITSDGSPPNSSPQGSSGNTIGELWLDKSTDPSVLRVYDGSNWVDAGSGGGGSPGAVTLQRWVKTVTGGETSLSGPDNTFQVLSYTPGLEEVFLNGVLLTRDVDYFASSGTSITSLSPLTAGDEVTVLGWTPFNVLDAINGSNLVDGSVTQQKLASGISLPVADGSIFDINVNDAAAIAATKLSYAGAGAGAVARAVDLKLSDVVSIKDFGAVGDGVTNDKGAIQAALNTGKNVLIPDGVYRYDSTFSFTADGQTLFGLGNNSVLKSGPGSVYINITGRNDVGIRNLKIDGDGTNGGITIRDGSSNVKFSEIHFFKGQQRVWIFTANHIVVENCTFEETGYGVIQQAGFSSDHVLVTACLAKKMYSDFVEANCTGSALSYMWSVTNCVYSSNFFYPSTKTEGRFVGITGVEGIIISGNLVEKVAGDAAVHLEDALGETVISNNIFDNCLASGGQEGYIYLLNNAENTVIANNIFLRTDPSLPKAYAVWSANNYNHTIQFVGNRVQGTGPGSNLSGPRITDFYGIAIISDNTFEDVNWAVFTSRNSHNISFTGNYIKNSARALEQSVNATGVGYTNWLVANNVFTGTTGNYDFLTRQNTNGTNPPKKVFITGNKFSKEVRISGGSGVYAAEDIQVVNNVFSATASLSFGGTILRRISSGNVFEATGDYALNASTMTVESARITASKTPASATAPGLVGEVVWDANYVYVCVANNTWRRALISAW